MSPEGEPVSRDGLRVMEVAVFKKDGVFVFPEGFLTLADPVPDNLRNALSQNGLVGIEVLMVSANLTSRHLLRRFRK